jgi:hypothetical protein
MPKPTDRVRITIELTAEEAQALAQMCKRFRYDDATRLANRHDEGKERDHVRDAISILCRGLGEQACSRLAGGPCVDQVATGARREVVKKSGSRGNGSERGNRRC